MVTRRVIIRLIYYGQYIIYVYYTALSDDILEHISLIISPKAARNTKRNNLILRNKQH